MNLFFFLSCCEGQNLIHVFNSPSHYTKESTRIGTFPSTLKASFHISFIELMNHGLSPKLNTTFNIHMYSRSIALSNALSRTWAYICLGQNILTIYKVFNMQMCSKTCGEYLIIDCMFMHPYIPFFSSYILLPKLPLPTMNNECLIHNFLVNAPTLFASYCW